jgi:hypothetical protein
VHRAAGVGEADHACLAGHRALHLEHHLAHVELGHDEGLDRAGQLADAFGGERPGDDQAQVADLDAFALARFLDGRRRPGGDAVGDHHHVGALDAVLAHVHELVGVVADLVEQSADQLVLRGAFMAG